MKLTYYGHACIGVKTAQTTLLFDPYIRSNKLASAIKPEDIDADYLLISHGHADHMEDAPEIMARGKAELIANFEIANWFVARGFSKVHPMNIGGRKTFSFGRVTLTPALHSSELPDGTYGGMAGSFIIEAKAGTIFYAGDTGLTAEMEIIGRTRKPSIAILPIGGTFTMDAEDAVEAARMLGVNRVVGIHFDTFPAITINHQHTMQRFDDAGIDFNALNIGQTINI